MIIWQSAHMLLDDLDRRIVDELRADGRMSVPALAERVGASRATAYARFDRLVDSGVITGFRATVDPGAVGLGVAALLLLSVRQGAWRDLKDRLAALPGVEWVALAAGPFDFVLLVRAADLAQLRDVVLGEIQAMPEVRNSQTILLLDEVAP
jgi:DNA-binding Lrp family transcriptional regulator